MYTDRYTYTYMYKHTIFLAQNFDSSILLQIGRSGMKITEDVVAHFGGEERKEHT